MKTLRRQLCRVCEHPDYIAACALLSKIAESIAVVNRGIDAAASAIATYHLDKSRGSDEAFVAFALSALAADPEPGAIAEFVIDYQRLLDARVLLLQAERVATKALQQVHQRLVRAGHKP